MPNIATPIKVFPKFQCRLHDYITKIKRVSGVIYRPKIDPLKLWKRYINYIWGASALEMELDAPISVTKITFFTISQVETLNVPVTKMSKLRYVSWPISQKRLKKTKRHLQGFKHGSSWVQINKQIENRFTLGGGIPTSRYRTNWPKWPISGPVSRYKCYKHQLLWLITNYNYNQGTRMIYLVYGTSLGDANW